MDKKAKLWKKLSSDILLDHERLSIIEDTVLLPNGKKSKYIHIAPNREDSVIMIAINHKNEIAVQKEYSYPPNKIMWQLPGGSMNKNEEIELAAKRELAEESGYSANKTEIIGYFYTQNRLSNQRQHVVLCTELYKHELPADEDEFIDTYWITKKKIELMISKGDINNINTLAALNIWFYNRRKL